MANKTKPNTDPEKMSYLYDTQFEFDDSDNVWTNPTTDSSLRLSETKKSSHSSTTPTSSHRRPAPAANKKLPLMAGGGRSLPVNIPAREWRKKAAAEEEEDEGIFMGLAPHEYLAKTRAASLSVHEGVGRTLKGRDLSRVRDAIWKQTGFQD